MKFLLLPLLFALVGALDTQVWKLPTKDKSEKRYMSMAMRDNHLYAKIVVDYGCARPLALLMKGGYITGKSGQMLMYAFSDELNIGGGCKVSNLFVGLGTLSKDEKTFKMEANVYSDCKCEDKSKNESSDDDISGTWERIK